MRTLNATDRCDRCGAQAYVQVQMLAEADLLFCGHHFRKYELRLMVTPGVVGVVDERQWINAKPSPSV